MKRIFTKYAVKMILQLMQHHFHCVYVCILSDDKGFLESKMSHLSYADIFKYICNLIGDSSLFVSTSHLYFYSNENKNRGGEGHHHRALPFESRVFEVLLG